jgi:hypothetical protein
VIGPPSRLRFTRKGSGLVRVMPTLDLRCEENVARRNQFPDKSVRIKGTQIHYVTSQTY